MNPCQIFLVFLMGMQTFAVPQSKIQPQLIKSLNTKGFANIFVKFEEGTRPSLNGINHLTFNSRTEKITAMVGALKALASFTQRNAIAIVQSPKFAYSPTTFKQFWVSNELFVKGATAQLVADLSNLPEVTEIREERIIILEETFKEAVSQDEQWNLDKIEASNAWSLPGGNNGQGVVVANINTGCRATHKEIRRNFRADYGWFDPYGETSQPSDSWVTGTHTMGTMVGAGVGVAPGAQWIACQGCNFIFCEEEALKACAQWTICPTRPNGTEEDCSKSARIVSNSWGTKGNNEFFNDVIFAWEVANIIPIFALGNSGATCSTGGSPGDQDRVIGVSATTRQDSLAGSSSAGPALDGRIKPELSAPGVDIRSASGDSDTAYAVISGSTTSAPLVAGAVALLISRNQNLTFDQVVKLLEENADTNLADMNMTCGGIPSTHFPNNQYGHGRLNARKALEAAINFF